MTIEGSIIFLFFIWAFMNYGPPLIIMYYLNGMSDAMKEMYEKMGISKVSFDILDYIEDTEEMNGKNKPKEPVKYEDKYLEDIRKMDKDWQLSEADMDKIKELTSQFFEGAKDNLRAKISEMNEEINNLENENNEDVDEITFEEVLDEFGVQKYDDKGNPCFVEETLEMRTTRRNAVVADLREKIKQLETDIQEYDITNSEKEAYNYICGEKIEKLQNSYVMEKTPQGNVLMIYNKSSESFKYYADSTIPYRYLEVVGRKYVKTFNCRPLFVDMEEELKLCEERLEKEKALKLLKEKEEKEAKEANNNNNINGVNTVEKKRDVFAKFKSYNKDAGGKISMAAPPKNSIPNKNIKDADTNETVLLKERANRYTYEGKFANFKFTKKVEKKVFNKKLGLTFADFKKINSN